MPLRRVLYTEKKIQTNNATRNKKHSIDAIQNLRAEKKSRYALEAAQPVFPTANTRLDEIADDDGNKNRIFFRAAVPTE